MAKVKARVLVDCLLGKCNDVVNVDEQEVSQYKDMIDVHPEAVKYAESLKPKAEKSKEAK